MYVKNSQNDTVTMVTLTGTWPGVYIDFYYVNLGVTVFGGLPWRVVANFSVNSGVPHRDSE